MHPFYDDVFLPHLYMSTRIFTECRMMIAEEEEEQISLWSVETKTSLMSRETRRVFAQESPKNEEDDDDNVGYLFQQLKLGSESNARVHSLKSKIQLK